MKRLIDGREVDSASPEWRDECLARYVLSLPFKERDGWLNDFQDKHGRSEADALRRLILQLKEHRK